MSAAKQIPSDWTFYSLGILLILLGVAFLAIPLIAKTGAFSNVRIPWFVLYVYNKGGFYFVTSPLLMIASFVAFIFFLLARR